jgi:hypothetical protein
MEDSVEIISTNGLLSDIEWVNNIVAEEIKSRNEETSHLKDNQESSTPLEQEHDQEVEIGTGASTSSSLQEDPQVFFTHQDEKKFSQDGYKKSDIRFFLKEGTRTSPPTIHCNNYTTNMDEKL